MSARRADRGREGAGTDSVLNAVLVAGGRTRSGCPNAVSGVLLCQMYLRFTKILVKSV